MPYIGWGYCHIKSMASHWQSSPFCGKGYVGVDYGFNLYLEALTL